MLLVGAVIRRGGQILLVRERLDAESGDRWGIPGGRVEREELLHEALAREVAEETGLTVHTLGGLAFVSHHYEPAHRATALLLAYEVESYGGDLAVSDPDGFVHEVRFADVAECVRLVRETSSGPMRTPLLTYLTHGRPDPPVLSWFWRLDTNRRDPIAVFPRIDDSDMGRA